MDNRAGTGDGADPDIPDRLNMKVAGPAIAAGAVSLGLVLIGACGIGHKDVYVAPPPLAADLQVAPTSITHSGTTTPPILIPPSPSWRVAANTTPRRTTSVTATATAAGTTTGSTPNYPPYAPPTTPTTTTADSYYSDPHDRDPYDSTTTTEPPRDTSQPVEESDPEESDSAPTTDSDEDN